MNLIKIEYIYGYKNNYKYSNKMFSSYFCHNDNVVKNTIPTLACLSLSKMVDIYNIQGTYKIISKYCGSPEDFDYAKNEFIKIVRQDMIKTIFKNFQNFCLFYKKLSDHVHEIEIGELKYLNMNIFSDYMREYNLNNEDLLFLSNEIMNQINNNSSPIKCYGQYYRDFLSGNDSNNIDFVCETNIIIKFVQHYFIPFNNEFLRTEKNNYNNINIYKITHDTYPEIFIHLSLTSNTIYNNINVDTLYCDMINGGSIDHLYSNNQYLDKLQIIENCKNKNFLVLDPEYKPVVFHGESMKIIRDKNNKITDIENNISPCCDIGSPQCRPHCINNNSEFGEYILSQINYLCLQGWECINKPCPNLWCVLAEDNLAKEYKQYMVEVEIEFYKYWKNILDPMLGGKNNSDFCPNFKQNND
ncbi:hypothetical protein QJ854_gp194 [Moumouvirus goulette]|uniref:Uncharacterized protein n=1 Tax=Moumouvirus goulette TaxID=1247379 RepID=M1PHM5_9VIRU|nr:hypothetical protein QJ854_gp194 [Moumouvirus goulette]AGF85588.1 hypothetical protein glt_00783 [Moumouvirus goulette]